MNPWNALSPMSRLGAESLNVIHTDVAKGWSLASMVWDGDQCVGCRWDGDLSDAADLGNPMSHAKGTWFILPEPVASAALAAIKLTPAPKP